ncbi:MAG: hypothetical protein PVH19_01635 [Planctomycetia bacterium]|jgi:hypothetical protein
MTRKTKKQTIGDDLRITKLKSRGMGGKWAIGTINGHRFEALVFPEHAESESYELGQSRISKLWLQEIDTKKTAYIFDRGEDCAARTGLANDIVEYLAANLAELVYGNELHN